MTVVSRTRSFECLVFGFFLFFIGSFGRTVTGSEVIEAIIKLFGWFFIIIGWGGSRVSFHSNGIGNGYMFLVLFWIIQSIIMIIRGYLIDYEYQYFTVQGMINAHFFADHYILPYLMPLVLFVSWKSVNFDTFIKFSKFIAVIVAVLLLFNYRSIAADTISMTQGKIEDSIVFSNRSFAIFFLFAFSTFCYKYISHSSWVVCMLGLLCNTVILMMSARRGDSLVNAIVLCCALIIFICASQKKTRYLYSFLLLVGVIGAVYVVLNSQIFSFLLDRGFEDSRTEVDKAMLSQMNNFQLLFGKGLNGRYYHPLMDDDYWRGWRYGTETGFLNLVLKGGFVYAITYVVMLLIPALKGMFRSKNTFCRVAGLYIFISLLELYPFGWLKFDIKFLIIWLLIVLCMNKKVRDMNDLEVKLLFFPKS